MLIGAGLSGGGRGRGDRGRGDRGGERSAVEWIGVEWSGVRRPEKLMPRKWEEGDAVAGMKVHRGRLGSNTLTAAGKFT